MFPYFCMNSIFTRELTIFQAINCFHHLFHSRNFINDGVYCKLLNVVILSWSMSPETLSNFWKCYSILQELLCCPRKALDHQLTSAVQVRSSEVPKLSWDYLRNLHTISICGSLQLVSIQFPPHLIDPDWLQDTCLLKIQISGLKYTKRLKATTKT